MTSSFSKLFSHIAWYKKARSGHVTGAISEKYVAGSTTTWRDYIKADGGIAGERFNTSGTVTWRYFVNDHLGSSSVLTDGSGTVQERLSYDAWGKRRNANGSDNTTCSITSVTTRGFTGHEMMDSVCLVNANARVYDPALGRFMSADSMVPDPFNSQSFNRYSYVNNGPLSATDPTGHDNSSYDSPETLPTGDPYANGQPCWGCSGPGMDDGQPIVTGYTVTGAYSVDIPFDPSQSGSNTSSSSSSDFGSSDTGSGDTGAGEGDAGGSSGYGSGSGLGNAGYSGSEYSGSTPDATTSWDGGLGANGLETVIVNDTPVSTALPDDANAGNAFGTYTSMYSGQSANFIWNYGAFYTPTATHGEGLHIVYTGNNKQGLKWTQTVTIQGRKPNENGVPFNDHVEGSSSGLYDSENSLNLAPGEFWDTPHSGEDTLDWTAQTSLLRLNANGTQTTIATFQWGFTISGTNVTVSPVRVRGGS